MKLTHTHHIVPRHMGGTDEPSNLIELTIAEHAEAHRKLWEEHGKKEDRIAWLSLSSIIGSEEIHLERSSIGGLKNANKPKTEEHKKNISEAIKNLYQDDSIKKRISDSMRGNSNSKNHSSDEYKRKQSEAMKAAWAKRKKNSSAEFEHGART
jgi:hypothetical protein